MPWSETALCRARRGGLRAAGVLAVVLGFAAPASASDPQAAHPLVGRWKVATINGAPPPRFLSGTVRVIQANGQLVSLDLGAQGTARWDEGAVQKALREALTRGTWRADKERVYVANSPRREAGSAYTLTQRGRLLSLDPDPYFSNRDVPSQATYERLP